MEALPIACDLTQINAEERECHSHIAQQWTAAILAVQELPDGYTFQLPIELCATMGEFISRERLCCPFFTFTLHVQGDKLLFSLTGAAEVKDFIRHEFAALLPQGG